MPEALISLADKNHSPSPLTQLTEEERMFYATVRQFAQETIAPAVRTMDDEQQFAPGLVSKLFELGLMGIEIPEDLGGAGGSFFDAVLAIEAIASVDPANLKILLMDYDNFIAASIRRRLSECRCRCLEAIYLHPVWRTGHWSPHRLTD